MATALELWQQEQDAQLRQLTALRDRLEAGLKAGCPEAVIHGQAAAAASPHDATSPFPGLDGQVLAGGLGHGGRGLLGRLRLRQRFQRAFADLAGDAALE